MSGPSLEEERQAILDRMQMRRERYRRMLTVGGNLDDAEFVEPHAATHLAATPTSHDTSYRAMHSSAYTPAAYRPAVPMSAGHGPVIRVLMEHPFLCALGVAAVVAIGPRRILRTLTSGGTALSTFAGNQSNVDLAGRLLTMAGAYVQGRTKNG
ncbi:MAG TPA: hypothetical protein VJ654_13345 [Noviherbaspirillum sp.]|nr:hypothetical protein [Noviherbaspirillum sp.]